jgi:ribosomal-protein-alanine N-acetyltransferase
VDHLLSTERLVLRPVTAGDHAALLGHWTQPDVRRFLFDGAALSAAEVAETIEESTGDFAARGFGVWLIELGSAAGLVGSCLLYTTPSPRDMRRSRMPSYA